jgi:PAS domain S-box-containing protein
MLQTLFDRESDAVLVLDDERRCLEANPAACTLFGTSHEQLLRSTVDDFLGRESGFGTSWSGLIASGHQRGDATVRAAGGRTVPVEFWAQANFAPGRHLAVFRDVSERRRTELELGASAEFLHRLIQSSRDCIKVLDLEGRLLSMNAGGAALLELDDAARYLGASWLDLWGSDERPAALDAIRRAAGGEAVRFEAFALTVAGTPKWWETAVSPVNGADGRPERLLAVTRDVTERVRSQRDRAFLADAADALAVSLDYGLTLQRIVDLPVPFLSDVAILDVLEEGTVRRVLRADAGLPDSPHFAVPGAASPAWGEGRALLVREVVDANGRVGSLLQVPLVDPTHLTAGFLTLATALSGRRLDASHLALAEQFALRATLALQNARLYAAEQRARESADAASRTKDEFLATLAHELRNPLGAIVTSSAALEVIGSHAPEARQARAVIRRQTEHLAGLLDDLLDVARIGQGKIELQAQVVDLRAVAERAFEAVRHRFGEKGQSAHLSVPDHPLAVRGDAVRLAQVAANLLTNACRYTPRGGTIDVRLGEEDGQAVLRVRDDGVGIAADKLGMIFELFAQVTQARAHGGGGLGIGLAVVKRLTEMHGGSVVARSEGEGRGTEFEVRLPLTADALPTAALPVRGEAPARRRILVIEDNADARDVLALSLQLDGHEVRVAGSGAEGLTEALSYRPAVILVDIGLPDASGHDVGRRLRQEMGTATLLVALSGYGQPEDRRRSTEAGFDAHVVKPATPDDLRSVLARSRPA